MAFYQVKSNNRVVVYVWDSEAGKQVALPRKLTKHLDGQLECNIKDWVRRYDEAQRRPKPQYDCLQHPVLERHVEDYCQWRRGRNKKEKTVEQDRTCLLRYVLPFFVTVNGLDDPNLWPTVSAKFLAYVSGLDLPTRRIEQCNTAGRGFWQYLQDVAVIPQQGPLRLIPPVRVSQPTPLKYTLTPEKVLEFVLGCPHEDVRVMALLGFFCSLRTQETLAAKPSDLRAGTEASALECCQVMERFGLFSKLAFHVQRQKEQDGTIDPEPKAHSRGWVACFDQRAANLLVKLVNKYEDPDALMFAGRTDSLCRRWRLHGIKGITLKDLRRASLYWLGHHTKLGDNTTALKSHARHKKTETTELYLRRPGEKVTTEWKKLSLDA